MNIVDWIPASEAKEKAHGMMWVTALSDEVAIKKYGAKETYTDFAIYSDGYWWDISMEWSFGDEVIAFAEIEHPLPYETHES